jgi:predicted secreted protein
MEMNVRPEAETRAEVESEIDVEAEPDTVQEALQNEAEGYFERTEDIAGRIVERMNHLVALLRERSGSEAEA